LHSIWEQVSKEHRLSENYQRQLRIQGETLPASLTDQPGHQYSTWQPAHSSPPRFYYSVSKAVCIELERATGGASGNESGGL